MPVRGHLAVRSARLSRDRRSFISTPSCLSHWRNRLVIGDSGVGWCKRPSCPTPPGFSSWPCSSFFWAREACRGPGGPADRSRHYDAAAAMRMRIEAGRSSGPRQWRRIGNLNLRPWIWLAAITLLTTLCVWGLLAIAPWETMVPDFVCYWAAGELIAIGAQPLRSRAPGRDSRPLRLGQVKKRAGQI